MPPNEKPTSLDELYAFLKRFSLSDSLFVIGVINASLKYGFKKVHKDGIPEPVIQWLNQHCKEENDPLSISLYLTRVARFLILSGTNDFKEPFLDLNTPQLHTAINLTSSLWDKEAEGEITNTHDVSTVFGRIGQWQFPLQSSRTAILGRAHLLFIAIPKEISCRYDLNAKMNEYFEMSIFQYIASGIALWIMTTGVLKHNLTIEVDALKNHITTKSIRKFVELSSGTAEDYRRYIRGDAWKKANNLYDIYGLDPFIFMPAIRVQRTRFNHEKECYMVPQPFYLLQRASLGAFYLLADKEREIALAAGHSGRNDFRDTFGDIYRTYVGKNLNLSQGQATVLDLDTEIMEYSESMKPDFAILEGSNCILFEVKTAPFSVTSRTVFDKEKAREEIQKGSFKKAMDQLNAFESLILQKKVPDERFKNISNVVKIVVLFEDIFLANAFLLPMVRDIYSESVTANLQIFSISDIEAIGSALASKNNIARDLVEKISERKTAEEASAPFFLRKAKTENPLLKRAYEHLMQGLVGSENLPF